MLFRQPPLRDQNLKFAPLSQVNQHSRLFLATMNYTKRITTFFPLFLLIVVCISVNLRLTQDPFGPCQAYIVANKVETFLCFTLVTNEFNVYLILTTELQIFHLLTLSLQKALSTVLILTICRTLVTCEPSW